MDSNIAAFGDETAPSCEDLEDWVSKKGAPSGNIDLLRLVKANNNELCQEALDSNIAAFGDENVTTKLKEVTEVTEEYLESSEEVSEQDEILKQKICYEEIPYRDFNSSEDWDCVDYFNNSIDLNPNSLVDYYNKALINFRWNRYSESLNDFNKAILLHEESINSSINMDELKLRRDELNTKINSLYNQDSHLQVVVGSSTSSSVLERFYGSDSFSFYGNFSSGNGNAIWFDCNSINGFDQYDLSFEIDGNDTIKMVLNEYNNPQITWHDIKGENYGRSEIGLEVKVTNDSSRVSINSCVRFDSIIFPVIDERPNFDGSSRNKTEPIPNSHECFEETICDVIKGQHEASPSSIISSYSKAYLEFYKTDFQGNKEKLKIPIVELFGMPEARAIAWKNKWCDCDFRQNPKIITQRPKPQPTSTPIQASYSLNKSVIKLTDRFSGFSCVSDFNLKILNTGDKEDMNLDVKWYDKEGNLLASGSEIMLPSDKGFKYIEQTSSGNYIYYPLNFGTADCWNYSDVTKDLYGKGVIVINGEQFPFVEVTIE